MPYKKVWEPQGLLTSCYGFLTCDEVVTFINAMCGHEQFDTIDYRIVDLTDVAETSITMEDVKNIIGHDLAASLINSKLKFALVVVEEDMRAIASFYKHRSTEIPWEIEIFSTLDEARHWISADSNL